MPGRIETLLNRNLASSPRARALCAELAGRRLWIEVRSTPWWLWVESTGTTLALGSQQAAPTTPETLVRGTPIALLALGGSDAEAAIQRGDVRIEGDAQLAGRFREMLSLLRPDPEEELSRLVGDVPAHRIAGFARSVFGWGRGAADTLVRNLAEYLAEERGDLVPRGEAEAFFADVERLRDDVERLAARLAQLEARRP